MTVTINGNGDFDLKVRGWSADETYFDCGFRPVDVLLSSGEVTPMTESDVEYNVISNALVRRDATVFAQLENNVQLIRYESADPSIATVDENGYVTRVSDGTARIVLHTSKGTRTVYVPVSQAESGESIVLTGYTPGSLAEHILTAIESRISAVSPAVGKSFFSSMNHDTMTYVRNPQCWMSDCTNKSAFSVWNSRQQQKQAGTLVTPRDFICVDHYSNPMNVGDRVRFVSDDNVCYEGIIAARTYFGSHAIGGWNPATSYDLELFTLEEDVPSYIKFVKIPPASWRDYLPVMVPAAHSAITNSNFRLPIFTSDQEKKALVAVRFPSLNNFNNLTYVSVEALWLAFSEGHGISGDSGSPAGHLINNELMSLGLWSGSYDLSYPPLMTLLNSTMTAHGSPHELTEFDLSGFPTY